ncbi:MAG: hypothetical protein QM764_13490 [Chitinophagaceae bacterium]
MARNGKDIHLSLGEVHESIDTTSTHRPVWRRILSFFGPAYLVSVGYMDPVTGQRTCKGEVSLVIR